MRRGVVLVALLLALGTFGVRSVAAQGAGPSLADQVRGLSHHAQEGMEAAENNRPDLMRAKAQEIEAIWSGFEDRVGAQNPDGYAEIEGALAAINAAVEAPTIDPAAARAAYTQLDHEANDVADHLAGVAASAPQAQSSPSELLSLLDSASARIAQGDPAGASAEIDRALRAWPGVEGAVAAKSQDAYTQIEVNLARAGSALKAQPADLGASAQALDAARSALAPFAGATVYTAFDAAAIILREGLEALLVIVALLAFLRRSNNDDKRGWIWAGGAVGVLASVVAALALQTLFNRVSAGQNREVIEGATGLVAAAMLFYVSYWLHSKSNIHAWQRYINARTGQALARGSMVGLALLAFLAVFREGAETTIFYLGMAPAIALRDLMLGLGLGVGALVVAALLMLLAGVRLPLRPFFRVAGLLVYYLGFKFVGSGIHALQTAGVVSSSDVPGAPTAPFLGFYPTWETLLPQLALLLGALLAFLYLRARDRRIETAAATITA